MIHNWTIYNWSFVGLPDHSYHPAIGPFEYRGSDRGPDRPCLGLFLHLTAHLNISLLRKVPLLKNLAGAPRFCFLRLRRSAHPKAHPTVDLDSLFSFGCHPSLPLRVLSSSIKPLDNATYVIDPSKGAWEYRIGLRKNHTITSWKKDREGRSLAGDRFVVQLRWFNPFARLIFVCRSDEHA